IKMVFYLLEATHRFRQPDVPSEVRFQEFFQRNTVSERAQALRNFFRMRRQDESRHAVGLTLHRSKNLDQAVGIFGLSDKKVDGIVREVGCQVTVSTTFDEMRALTIPCEIIFKQTRYEVFLDI